MSEPGSFWKKCSACKKPIPFEATYYVCSVSTCNRKRTALQFCTVSCWEVHLPVARHREAWAEDRVAPDAAEAARQLAAESRTSTGAAAKPAPRDRSAARPATPEQPRAPRRILVDPAAATRGAVPPSRGDASRGPNVPREVLIVGTRLKDYIRAVSGMNTSDRVLGPLSEIVREVADRAIERARADGRKTVLDRDVPKP